MYRKSIKLIDLLYRMACRTHRYKVKLQTILLSIYTTNYVSSSRSLAKMNIKARSHRHGIFRSCFLYTLASFMGPNTVIS